MAVCIMQQYKVLHNQMYIVIFEWLWKDINNKMSAESLRKIG